MLSASKTEQVSQNCFVFDVAKLQNEDVSQKSLKTTDTDRQMD